MSYWSVVLCNILYMSDLLLNPRGDGTFDLFFENGDLQMGKSLENAVLVSLGSDARVAEKSFRNELQDDGWWGEPTFEGDKWGSLLHTVFKRKNDPNVVLLAKQYAEDSLKWIVEDGVAKSVNVDVSDIGNGLSMEVSVTKGDEEKKYRYELLWNEVA